MSKKTKGILTRNLPMQLPETSTREVRALKAMATGEASNEQQLLVYSYIVKKMCNIGGLSYHESSPTLTAFNEGKRHVGLSLLNLVETPLEALKKTAITLTKDELQES